MNTVSLIVSIAMPSIVIGYIVWDLFSSKTSNLKFLAKSVATKKNVTLLGTNNPKIPAMSWDAEVDEINHATMKNEGDRLSQSEIIENTEYLLNNYADIL
jgi:hypothetical protein